MDKLIDLDRFCAYLKTPAGCDGGNIAGNNWIFAIEYGGETNIEDYQELVVDHRHGCVPDDRVQEFIEAYPFNRRIAQFEAAKHGRPVESYREFAQEVAMFTKASEYYKGNIGGLQFAHDDDQHFEPIGHLLGLQSKAQLKDIEAATRSAMFQKWVKTYSPNCICCFGTGDADRFFRAFSDVEEKPEQWSRLEGFRYYHGIINQGKTNLFILPHPTAKYGQGLTEPTRLSVYGEMVRQTMFSNGFQVI